MAGRATFGLDRRRADDLSLRRQRKLPVHGAQPRLERGGHDIAIDRRAEQGRANCQVQFDMAGCARVGARTDRMVADLAVDRLIAAALQRLPFALPQSEWLGHVLDSSKTAPVFKSKPAPPPIYLHLHRFGPSLNTHGLV